MWMGIWTASGSGPLMGLARYRQRCVPSAICRRRPRMSQAKVFREGPLSPSARIPAPVMAARRPLDSGRHLPLCSEARVPVDGVGPETRCLLV